MFRTPARPASCALESSPRAGAIHRVRHAAVSFPPNLNAQDRRGSGTAAGQSIGNFCWPLAPASVVYGSCSARGGANG
ncbi:hypothetical protein BER93_13460 [Xanthomonas fragariae]|nr:hypothetical protein BER93_13460 [Xanthomonas fragariae]